MAAPDRKEKLRVQPDVVSPPSEHSLVDLVEREPPRPRGLLHKIQAFVWDDPDKPPAEKKFLRKLDFFLLTYTCLGYFVGYQLV